jgi:cytochrome P450
MLQIDEYDEIQEILRSPDFEQGAFELTGPTLVQDVVSILHGQPHFERRRVEAHLFAQEALRRYLDNDLIPMVDHVLATRLHGAPGDVACADLVELTWHMLCRLAGSVVGLDRLDDPDVLERLVDYAKVFGRGLTVEWATTGDQQAVIAETLATRERFAADLFAPSLRRRLELVERFGRGEIERDDLPNDLIALLLLHRNDPWDEELPLREATLFLVAATQTTVQAFPHFVLHLEGWFAEDAARRTQVLSDPDLLARAAHESLRLFVASPVRIRRARSTVTLSSGRSIAAGQRVGLLLQAANTDPAVFGADADSYNPAREVGRVPRWGLAFGGGPHMCIGRPLVTGALAGGGVKADGSMVTIASRLYQLGMRLDPHRPPERDAATFHPAFASVPVILRIPH